MGLCCAAPKVEPGILAGSRVDLPAALQKPIITIFEERIRQKKISGDRPAVHFSERAMLTYTQLNALASCLARNIIDRLGYDYRINNPDQELIVAMCLPMSEKALALVLGILKTGAAYLPLDPQYPENLLVEILNAVKPVLLITDDNGKIFNKFDLEKFATICKICSIEELWLDADFALEPKTRRASMEKAWDIDVLDTPSKSDLISRPVVVFHSHGLRNNPVAVRLSNRTIVNLVAFMWNKLKLSQKDIWCVTVSLASPISIAQVFIPLLFGCTIHLFRRSEVMDMDNFVKGVSWSGITKLSIPTHQLGDFLESIAFLGKDAIVKSLKKLKQVICFGSFIAAETAQEFFSVFTGGVTLGSCSGSIESLGAITLEMYSSWKNYQVCLLEGRPTLSNVIDNVKLYILDSNSQIVPDGTQGEICVSGQCLAMGYVTTPSGGVQVYAGTFAQNPFKDGSPIYDRMFRTGECGHIAILSKGKRGLYLEGRNDAFVKVRGHLLITDDVVEFLKDFETVADARVDVTNAGKRNQQIVGLVTLKKGIKDADIPTPSDFDFTLRDILPDWAIPDEIQIMPSAK